MERTGRIEDERLSLTYREKKMIECLFKDSLTAKDIYALTEGLDIEECNQNYLLMLSCLGYSQGWRDFPQKMVPRLQGIHRYYQVYNTMWIPWLIQKIHVLRQAGIPVMLIKGLALRFYYIPGVPRIMNDFDIAVPEEKYVQALELLQDEESTLIKETLYHGEIRSRHITLELHRWIFKNHGDKNTDIWEKAIHFNFQGEDVCIPDPEDMFIHQMDNRSGDIVTNIFPDRRINWIYDCRKVLEQLDSLNLIKLSARAESFGVVYSVQQMLPEFADCFPDVISQSEIDRVFPDNRSYRKWLKKRIKFREAYLYFQSFKSAEDEQMTPFHIIRRVGMYKRCYQYKYKEMKIAAKGWSFGKYIRETMEIHSFEDLWRFLCKYVPKMRLQGGGREE